MSKEHQQLIDKAYINIHLEDAIDLRSKLIYYNENIDTSSKMYQLNDIGIKLTSILINYCLDYIFVSQKKHTHKIAKELIKIKFMVKKYAELINEGAEITESNDNLIDELQEKCSRLLKERL